MSFPEFKIGNSIVYQGDALAVLKTLPDEIVDTGVTSPPYFGLRDYRVAGQLGQESSFLEYVDDIVAVAHEFKRVLKRSGSFFLNLGDSWGTHKSGEAVKELESRAHATIRGFDKCAMMIPERIALKMIDDGWILRSKAIWVKPNHMPSSDQDKFTPGYENIYFFVKNNDALLWRHRKTKQWVNRKPQGIAGIEGTDWSWREKIIKKSKLTKLHNYELLEDIDENYAKIRIKRTLWRGFDYYFDLDNIRIPRAYQSDVERRIRQDHEDGIVPFAKGSETLKWKRDTRPPGILRQKLYPGSQERYAAIGDPHLAQFINPNYEGKFDGEENHELFGSPRARTQRKQDNVPSKNANTYEGFNERWKEAQFNKLTNPTNEVAEYMRTRGSGGHFDYGGLNSQEEKKNYAETALSNSGKNPGDVWVISTDPFPEAHFATFPTDIPEMAIKSSCPPDGTILDPFCGSGTTLYVANKLARKSIGIELNPKYISIIQKRLETFKDQKRLSDFA